MTPQVPEAPRPEALTRTFLHALQATGFAGEIAAGDADRMVLATYNSIYRVPPQAVLLPRDTADVAQVMRLLTEERFRAVVLAPRGGGYGPAPDHDAAQQAAWSLS